MSNINIFEVANRSKFRFPFKGLISVEDLWDLTVENLDSVFKSLNSQLKQAEEESLLNTKTKADKDLDTMIEIVKHIVNIKLEEQTSRLKAKEQREKKQKLMEILSDKQEENLRGKTAEEIQKMIEELDS